jgi:hypothetical protein
MVVYQSARHDEQGIRVACLLEPGCYFHRGFHRARDAVTAGLSVDDGIGEDQVERAALLAGRVQFVIGIKKIARGAGFDREAVGTACILEKLSEVGSRLCFVLHYEDTLLRVLVHANA